VTRYARCAREHRLWWRVVQREQSFAFNGRGTRPSEYSMLACLECRRTWRTKASYVSRTRDITPDERRELRKPRILGSGS
jgi:hypothetical protein